MPMNSISVGYLYWQFIGQSKRILTTCSKLGATVDSIEMKELMNFPLSVPPLPEQQSIVQYIESETARIDAKKEKTEKLIDLLTEYRAALISEVVTGKVNVLEV